MNKNNTGKLLVAVLAMAMVIAGCAVVFSDDVQAETVKPTDFLKEIDENGGVYTVDGNQEVTVTEPITGLKQIKGTEGQNYTLTINFQATQKYQAMIVVDDTEGLKIDGVNVVLNMTAASNLNDAGDGLTVFGGKSTATDAVDSEGPVTVQNGASLTISQDANAHGASWRAGDLIVNNATVDFNQANSTGSLNVDLGDATLKITNPNATPGNLRGDANESKIIVTGSNAASLNLYGIKLTDSTINTDGDVGVYEGQTVEMTGSGSSIIADEIYIKNSSADSAATITGGTVVGDIVDSPDNFGEGKEQSPMKLQSTAVNGNITGPIENAGFTYNGQTLTSSTSTITGVISKNTDVPAGAVLIDVTLNPGVTMTFKGDATVVGSFRFYGTLANGTNDNVTITADKVGESVNSITAFNGAKINDKVSVAGTGDIDITAAMSTMTITQNIVSSVTYSQAQTIVVGDEIVIESSYYLRVHGQLIVNEGCSIIIEDNATLYIGEKDVARALGMIVDGTIQVEEGGQIVVEEADEVAVNGAIISNGTVDIQSKVTINDGASIEIEDSDVSKIVISEGLTIENGGELLIAGDMDIKGISNKGTVTLDGASIIASSTIKMDGDGSVVDIKSFTANAGIGFTITDAGMVLEKDKNGNAVKSVSTDAADTTSANGLNNINFSNANAGVGVRGLTITQSVTSEKDGDETVYTNKLIIGGSISINNDSDNEVDAYTVNVRANGGVDVNDLTLGKGVTLNLVGGEMNVPGTITATAEGAVLKVSGGEVYVDGMITIATENLTGDIIEGMNAFHYEDADNCYYTTLKTAVDNAAEDIDYYGNVKVLENVDVPTGTTLAGVSGTSDKITIGSFDNRDVVVTFADGTTIRNANFDVDGTLIFENEKDKRSTVIVESDVVIKETPKITYTNVYTALEADSGTITLSDRTTVYLDKDAEIKAGVTLEVPAGSSLMLYNDVTLTVNGILKNSGTVDNVKDQENGANGAVGFNPEVKYNAEIVVNGAFMNMSEVQYSKYYIPGAYYQLVNTDGAWFYVTPVEQAATISNDVEEGAITIHGKNTVGDVAFTGDEDVPVEVQISSDATLDAGTVTISNAGVSVIGGFTGTVASVNGSIDAVNATNFAVANIVPEDEEDFVTFLIGAPVAADGELDASMAVASGTINAGILYIGIMELIDSGYENYGVTADSVDLDSFVIVSGATLTADGDGCGITIYEMTVDGTLKAINNGEIIADTLVVKGTLDIVVADPENKIDAGSASIVNLYVGIAKDDKTGKFVGATAATVNAESVEDLDYVYVSGLSTVTVDLVERMDSTEFYVEDELWMTVYKDTGATALPIVKTTGTDIDWYFQPGDLADSEFLAWNDADGEALTGTVNVGPNAAKVYADLDYNIYTVTVFADPGITSVYIDGKLMVSGVFMDGTDGMWNEGFRLSVAAGTHEITYKLGNYYSGEATMTVNGEAVTGTTFTTSGTTTADKNVTIYLQGIEASAPETPSTSGGDDGMGLTDYLLIILVVLIVIMAIMVAMRLMRS